MFRRFLPLICLMPLVAPLTRAAKENLPLPRMVVARADSPPTIDGKMAPGEWDGAAACSAFTVAFHGQLAKNQSVAWMTHDDAHIYVCMKNSRGEHDTLLSKRARETDDQAIVFDHSNEIWMTPPAAPQATYQTLFNAYPGVFDVQHIPSVGYTAMAWRGNWQIASSETRDHWIVEAKAPIKSFGRQRIADGDVWRGLFTTDVLGKGGGFRAWAPGGAFAEINRHGTLHFRREGPVFQLLDVESIFSGRLALSAAVAMPPVMKRYAVAVTVRCGASVKAADGDLVLTKQVVALGGAHEKFTLSGDLAKLDLPTKKVVIQEKPRVETECKHGVCEVTAKTSDGGVLYHQIFPFTLDGIVRKPPAAIRKSPYDAPFGLQASHAPLSRKLLVKIDRLYMPDTGKSDEGRLYRKDPREGGRHEPIRLERGAVRGYARLYDVESKRSVVMRPIAAFRNDYSQFAMDLVRVDVPVQTEADWAKAQAVLGENKTRVKAGKPPRDVPGPKPAEYLLEVVLQNQRLEQLAKHAIPVKLVGYEFEWLGNRVGMSDKVIAPWTPMQREARWTVMWNKRYRLNGLGLAEQIVNGGRKQLAGPMKLVAVIGDTTHDLSRITVMRHGQLRETVAEQTGRAQTDDLQVAVLTHTEFDGCVLNTMTVTPQKAIALKRLSLEVRMPKAEAPCFVTTAGGWSAQHGWTPQRWTSKETASGSRVGTFVPYVFLTDSDRGFCVFADNDEGWRVAPGEPTHELWHEGGTTVLRINFVHQGAAIDKPFTVRYGWMVTPQKPQPRGWRATHIAPHKPYPKATTVFYGMDNCNWAVLWPYYSSPFPWDYEKSKTAFDRSRENGVVLCAGNIAHAIARYRDAKGRWFNELAADWGSTPGDRSNGNVTRCRGANDFQLWHFDQWVKRSGMQGIYFDENYLSEEWNYLTGNAWLLPDERVQPGYSYLGLRSYNKRLRHMFAANGLTPPNLWLHTTSGHPVYAWMPDVAMEGENVSPTGMDNDYMSCLPASRLRAIGMGRNLGAAALIMCQADRHWNPAFGDFMIEQFVGWVLGHDCLPEGGVFWPTLAAELEMWHPDIRFLPYWETGHGIESRTKDILVSAHVRPRHAVLWVVNTAREARKAIVRVDLKKLGLDAKKTVAFDAETGERYRLRDRLLARSDSLTIDVPARMWRAIRLVQSERLSDGVAFTAAFDGDEVAADEALGHRYARGRWSAVVKTVAGGKTGRAASLDEALVFDARHHVARGGGRIAFQLQVQGDKPRGTVLALDPRVFSLALDRGKLRLLGDKRRVLAEADLPLAPAPAWHAVEIRWQEKDFRVTVDGSEVVSAKLDGPVPVHPMSRGLAIQNYRTRLSPSRLTFGPLKGARLDDLTMAPR